MKGDNILNSATHKNGFAVDRPFLKGFLAKINLVFMVYSDRYPIDDEKVLYLIPGL